MCEKARQPSAGFVPSVSRSVGEITLAVAAYRGVVKAGLLAVGTTRFIISLAKVPERAGARAGPALRADFGGLLPTRVSQVPVDSGRRVALCESRAGNRKRRRERSEMDSLLHWVTFSL